MTSTLLPRGCVVGDIRDLQVRALNIPTIWIGGNIYLSCTFSVSVDR